MLVTMGASFAPLLHAWHWKILPRIGDIAFKGWSKTTRVLASIALDQLVFTPIVLYASLLFIHHLREVINKLN
jgi:hypothetical protein